MRKGIIAAGNWVIDQIKTIDSYPAQEELVCILEEYSSSGGSAYNVLKDLYNLQAPFPLEGIGLVGNDLKGHAIIDECRKLGIDTSKIRETSLASTSYTDVMSVKSTGKRTFFHRRGANALLDESHFDFQGTPAKIFHLGYLMMLDRLDVVDKNGETGACQVFKKAKEQGLITSADLVSDRSGEFKKVVPPSLPYIDYLFINEMEARMLTGFETTLPSGNISQDGCYKAVLNMIESGVQKWVFLHYSEGVMAMNNNKEVIYQPSVSMPDDKIVGTVGAGDAFAAGVLMGIHEEWEINKCLELGVASAATCLLKATCSDGIQPYEQCLSFAATTGYRQAYQPGKG